MLRDVLALGWSPAKVRAAVSAGRLARPHRGVLTTPDWAAPTARSALLVVAPTAAISHESAALEHGLWLPRTPGPLHHVTVRGAADRVEHGVRVHGSRLPEDFVEDRGGARITTIARTAMDCARGRSLPDTLIVLDSAARLLAQRTLDVDASALRAPEVREAGREPVVAELWQAFESVRAWPGSIVVRTAIPLVDLASESPMESRSRGWFLEASLPAPLTGYSVTGASGAAYWADFAWPDRRVLGEVDGTGKYGSDESTVRSRLRQERRRQRDLEDAGWRVVRWESVERRRTVVARVGRALL